jgi:uncharacterized Zn finger protein (UPF0148 family)
VTNPDTITSAEQVAPVTVKVCSKCGTVKELYGGKLKCVPCGKEYNRKYRQTPEYKEYKRKYNQTPDRKEYMRKYIQTTEYKERRINRQQTQEYKERRRKHNQTTEYKERRRDRRLRSQYGLSVRGKECMISDQENSCLCCKRKFDRSTPLNPLAPVVDHCHETGATRGILCSNCNLLIGHIRSRRHLHQAGRYLYGRDWQSTQENFL